MNKLRVFIVISLVSVLLFSCKKDSDFLKQPAVINSGNDSSSSYGQTNGLASSIATSTNWSAELQLGGFAKQVTSARNLDGRLEIFYVGTNDYIYHKYQLSPGGSWSAEKQMG